MLGSTNIGFDINAKSFYAAAEISTELSSEVDIVVTLILDYDNTSVVNSHGSMSFSIEEVDSGYSADTNDVKKLGELLIKCSSIMTEINELFEDYKRLFKKSK